MLRTTGVKNRLGRTASFPALIAASLVFGTAAATAQTAPDNPDIEVVVVTAAKGTAANVAPTKSSLDAFQPQSIISRTYIENSMSDVSDYTGIATIAPSVSGGVDNNGPGLSEKDAVIRGFQDGEYNVRYDGIPFGDTNDPTHHSTSYFPASVIGAVQIDRGPGYAGDLGQETLGGSMNLFSRTLSDQGYAQAKLSYGSWATVNTTLTLQSGVIDDLHGARFTANMQVLNSDGYLTYSDVHEYNQFVKFDVPINANWTITVLGTHNNGEVHQPDNNGITLAQAKAYGKNFTLSNDPALPTYFGYNSVRKETDFEYVRVNGILGNGFTLENTGYTYSYINHTLSATDTTQSASDILAGTYPGWGTKAGPKGNMDVAGYDKLNSYRVWGDIVRLNKDFDLFGMDGQARTGLWYEISETDRHRFDRDWTLGFIPNPIEKTPSCATSKPATCALPDPSVQFFERSSWTQYQPFLDVDFHPVDGLTITPGIKYLHFQRKVAAPVGSKTRAPQFDSTTYSHTLPFVSANYKASDSLALYAQYAQGFLVPPLKAFYVPNPTLNTIKPQTSTNYQLGAVYNVNNFTLDGDVYYVRAENAFQSGTVAVPGGGTAKIYFNDGTVDYKGIEAEGTYAFTDGMLDGLAAFANGSLNSARGQTKGMANYHSQIGQAPKWTAAFGLIYTNDGLNVSLVDKFTGQQWADDGEPSAYKIGSYSVANFVLGYDFGNFKLQGGVFNLFDNRSVTDISINDGPTPTDPNSHDQFFWMPERSYQLTLRVTLD